MPIVSSEIVSSVEQVDGRFAVKERHVDQTGRTYDFDYLADATLDQQAVLVERALQLGARVDADYAVVAAASGFTIPLTKLQFRQRFTPTERMLIDAFNLGFETNPNLTDDQKSHLRTVLEDYKVAQEIRLADSGTIWGVQMYEALGLIAAGRAAEILNG